MGRRVSEDEVNRYGRVAWNFFEKLQRFRAVEEKFKAIKEDFESEMESMFHDRSCNSIAITNHSLAIGEPDTIKVTKVERTSIRWNVDKLKKRVPREIAKQVLRKEYRITNMPQLVKYLKSCGVDPAVFKQFITVEESVDQDAIDKMGELGYVSPQQISGCYVVECSKPYFKVSMVKTKGNE